MTKMGKKAIIEVLLVEEAENRSNQHLEAEIFEDLSEYPAKIAWMKEVMRVKVEEI